MSKMPIDREEKQRDLFRRFGIPRLNEVELKKPNGEDGKTKTSEEKPPKKR